MLLRRQFLESFGCCGHIKALGPLNILSFLVRLSYQDSTLYHIHISSQKSRQWSYAGQLHRFRHGCAVSRLPIMKVKGSMLKGLHYLAASLLWLASLLRATSLGMTMLATLELFVLNNELVSGSSTPTFPLRCHFFSMPASAADTHYFSESRPPRIIVLPLPLLRANDY